MLVAEELLAAGHEVRVLDSCSTARQRCAEQLREAGVELIVADVRDADARATRCAASTPSCTSPRSSATRRARAIRPALRRSTSTPRWPWSQDAASAGVERFVFASTCSNYGRMADPTVPIAEDGVLAPVSLYAEQKVADRAGAARPRPRAFAATCLRFATVYGVAPRMRFDLTVNEFTRDLWSGRRLEVFGEQFWRPYVHVRDAARGVRTVLEAPVEPVAGEVFNVGDTAENYRKLDLVELIRRETDAATSPSCTAPRIRATTRSPSTRSPDGSATGSPARSPRASARSSPRSTRTRFEDAFDGRYRNIA